MARYVLLAIEDDKAATALVKQIQRWGVIAVNIPAVKLETTDEIVESVDIDVSATVRGVWARPTKFCECQGGQRSFSRGTKLGWWVHAACGKPSKLWADGHDWYRSLGTNLMPISDECPDWRGPNHKKHPGFREDVEQTARVKEFLAQTKFTS